MKRLMSVLGNPEQWDVMDTETGVTVRQHVTNLKGFCNVYEWVGGRHIEPKVMSIANALPAVGKRGAAAYLVEI